ncbi:FmdB family transcriptional regulator [Limnohabitans sp. Rim8]|uniref:FmdB family transcriptional regulator n=1 Tax=Limnohabitans curvus TaxID=323423 RepID=A0A315ESN2_9BURK|nr:MULTISPECIES: FmdB family zinc ribbon protein [Limnohabitans]PUE58974.1 FmdB family transcriptional regulator [Limnohabitans curvus]PUE62193.1 FmdB family transcriptional regulator [Limnohabitans sp. Rim8]
MPIYAYKCGSCGHAKDVLQKISDAPLTDCPECGKPTFFKQLTAAGFQLKGSGWYATDFKGGSGGTSAPAAVPADASAPSSDSAAAPAASSTSESSASTPAAAGGCGASCACH